METSPPKEEYVEKPATENTVTGNLVGVSGFEPEASWTRNRKMAKI